MTTLADHGAAAVTRIDCSLPPERNAFLPIELALRDMRQANGRDRDTGKHRGNDSWIGACLGMIVLDTLSGTSTPVWKRFKGLLTDHGIEPEDSDILYSVRCSLLHGYGFPLPSQAHGRDVIFTGDTRGYALDTRQPGVAFFSIPVFCAHLVERIAAAVPDEWDRSLTSENENVVHVGQIRLLPPTRTMPRSN